MTGGQEQQGVEIQPTQIQGLIFGQVLQIVGVALVVENGWMMEFSTSPPTLHVRPIDVPP